MGKKKPKGKPQISELLNKGEYNLELVRKKYIESE